MRPFAELTMKHLIVALAGMTALSAAPGTQTFRGTITDDMCGAAGHAEMRMGPTDAECTVACVEGHGAVYVLLEGKNVYTLSSQRLPAPFAGQRVTVTGTLDAKARTIRVDAIATAQ